MPFRPLQQEDEQTQEEQPGYFQRVGQQYKDIAQNVIGDVTRPAQSASMGASGQQVKRQVGEAGLRTVGNVAKAAFAPVMELPGVKQATDFVGETLAETPLMQKFAAWSTKHPEASKDIMSIADIASLFGGKAVEAPLARGATSVAKGATGAATGAARGVGGAVTGVVKGAPENIMNRVARLKPTDEVRFKGVAGKSPGQYLVDTGNFGPPDMIIGKEASKFAASKGMVDDALANLPGEYKYKPVDDALQLLSRKSSKISTSGVPAEFSRRVAQLTEKHKTQGLTMSEINEVKRIFEREVKLGYNKLTNPDLIQKATNVDSAIRRWQVEKADHLGFKNIRDLNKQTQISKFLVDKLGDQVVGQSALNNFSLTDWVILAGGDPTAVGAFLGKKFFSSKSVQARIAKMLSDKGGQGLITPEISGNPEYLNPSRLLTEGKVTPGQYHEKGGVITPKAPTTYESGAQQSTSTRTNPRTGDSYVRDLKTGKLTVVPKKKMSEATTTSSEPMGETLYHGTSKKSAEAIRNAGGFTDETAESAINLVGGRVPKDATVSLTLDKKTGELYSGARPEGGTGELLSFSSKGLKIADEATAKKFGKDITKLRKAGYDGYHTSSPHDEAVETIIFNKEKLKLVEDPLLSEARGKTLEEFVGARGADYPAFDESVKMTHTPVKLLDGQVMTPTHIADIDNLIRLSDQDSIVFDARSKYIDAMESGKSIEPVTLVINRPDEIIDATTGKFPDSISLSDISANIATMRDGNNRLSAARELGYTKMPVRFVYDPKDIRDFFYGDKAGGDLAVKQFEELLKKSFGQTPSKSQLTSLWEQAQKGVQYNSPLYRGGDVSGASADTVFLSRDKNIASGHGKVTEYTVPGAKILDVNDGSPLANAVKKYTTIGRGDPASQGARAGKIEATFVGKFRQRILDAGYDGVELPGVEIQIYRPEILKPKK